MAASKLRAGRELDPVMPALVAAFAAFGNACQRLVFNDLGDWRAFVLCTGPLWIAGTRHLEALPRIDWRMWPC